MIKDMVRDALAEQRLGVDEVAALAGRGVSSHFVRRLKSGEVPHQRRGRLTADRDPRYRQVAAALQLPVERFVAQAVAEQTGGAAPASAAVEPSAIDALLTEATATLVRGTANLPPTRREQEVEANRRLLRVSAMIARWAQRPAGLESLRSRVVAELAARPLPFSPRPLGTASEFAGSWEHVGPSASPPVPADDTAMLRLADAIMVARTDVPLSLRAELVTLCYDLARVDLDALMSRADAATS